MKKVFIIHGCPDNEERALDPEKRTYDKHWIPWLKRKLGVLGIEAENPSMPDPWKPEYAKFKEAFDRCAVAEEDILIGHSCGCAFLVRWLGDTKKKISQLILVAPWKIPYREDGSDVDFYGYQIDETIRERVGEIIIFSADDEDEGGKESARIFQKSLGGKIIELKNHGHYIMGDMGTEEFPELLEIIK